VEDLPSGASIGPVAVVVRVLAIVVANECIVVAVEKLAVSAGPLFDAIFRLAVTVAFSTPLFYVLVIRPLIRSFRAHTALERTVQHQGAALEKSGAASALSAFAETVVDTVPVGLAVLSTELRVQSTNRALRGLFALTERDVVGMPLERILSGVNPWRLVAEVLGSDQPSPTIAVDMRDANGRRHFQVMLTRLRQGAELRLLLMIEDITARERATRDVRESREALQDFLESASDLVQSVTADGRFVYVNRAWREAFGYRQDEMSGLTVFDVIHPDYQDACRDIWRRVLAGESIQNVETVLLRKDGRPINVEGNINRYAKDGAIVTRAIFRDVTERKQAAERLHHLAYYDTLTGLPNRVLFQNHLTSLLAQSRRTGDSVALLYVDLDRFKDVNDTLGHEAGDQLLKTVAQRLCGVVREGDSVCRLGGDEFAVLAGMSTPEGAERVARKFIAALAQPVTIEGREVSITPSIGIAISPGDGDDFHRLLKNADTAMYRAKSQRNAYQFYEAAMHARAFDRFELESLLRHALEHDQFEVFYEPQVDVASGRLAGFEALVRWRQPDGSFLPPAEFIQAAEETGLIVPLGEWVLNTVCGQIRAWRSAGFEPVRTAVNVSSRQLMQPDFSNVVQRALEAAGVDPSYVQLEITEHIFMRDTALTAATLRGFRDVGVTVAIDDFGTGYSSLSYLKRFPIDTLKIGLEFVRGVIDRPDDAAIVTAIVAMARSLGVRVVAEGIERRAQWEWLRAQGVDIAQGYLIAQAMPAEAAAHLLRPTWRFGLPQAA
jgi:diguanylate cyclase (GGDEF)-like protein/PAS domain S-box-containing protein